MGLVICNDGHEISSDCSFWQGIGQNRPRLWYSYGAPALVPNVLIDVSSSKTTTTIDPHVSPLKPVAWEHYTPIVSTIT